LVLSFTHRFRRESKHFDFDVHTKFGTQFVFAFCMLSRKKRWKSTSAKSIMAQFFLYLFAVIGILSVLAIILVFSFGAKKWWNLKQVPLGTVLEINFSANMIEYVPEGQITKLALGNTPQISDIVFGLQKAAKDKRIVGIIANTSAAPSNFGQIQEIRDAVLKFRLSGKPAFAYAQSFGEGPSGKAAYYLATAFDEIYLQPSGDLGLTGFISETRFIKTLLDKAGIKPQISAREEYKNFRNVFTETKYTKSHAEANMAIIQSFQKQLIDGVSVGRKLEKSKVIDLVERGPLSASQGLEAGLVDGLAYRDEVYEKVKNRFNKERFMPISRYLKKRFKSPRTSKIALIYGVGSISGGVSRFNPFTGNFIMGTETIVSAFEAAQKDPEVKAIVFRVESPGGSYIASDSIWREIVKVRKEGKPVVVSMGAVAGSGGYFIASAADRIVAHPATITGSIGVVGGKMVTGNFWNMLGVTSDEVHTSDNASIWSTTQEYTSLQWELIETQMNRIYSDFVNKVSSGRNIPVERVLKIAKGRIWSGEEAAKLGLVDFLGGIPVAINEAAKLAGVEDPDRIQVKRFPKEKSFWDKIFFRTGRGIKSDTVLFADSFASIMPLAKIIKKSGLFGENELLSMGNPDENLW
jgi:protease-4